MGVKFTKWVPGVDVEDVEFFGEVGGGEEAAVGAEGGGRDGIFEGGDGGGEREWVWEE